MKNKKQLTFNVILNFTYEILLLILPLITTPYVSRILGADGIGVFSYTKSIVTYFCIFAVLGTASYGMRTIAISRENKQEYSKKFWEIELLLVFSCSIALAGWAILSFLYQKYTIYLIILSVEIINAVFNVSWFFRGLEQFKYIVSTNAVIRVISIILLFLLVKTKDDLYIYIFLNVGSTLLGSISMWIFLPRFLVKTKISFSNIKNHLKQTLIFFGPAVATSVYTVLDKTLIGIFTQNEFENGYYEQATKIIDICKMVSFFSLNGVMVSRMSYLYGKNDIEGIKQGIKVTMNIALCLSIGCVFGVLSISGLFVPLFFGDGYDPTIILMNVLVFIVPIICISNVLASLYFTPLGKIKTITKFLISGAICNLILNIPLILVFNSLGAVIASIAAELLITVLYLHASSSFFHFKDLIKILTKKVIAGGGMFAFLLLFNYLTKDYLTAFMKVCLNVIIGVFIYLFILFVLRDSVVKDCLNAFRGKKDSQTLNQCSPDENVGRVEDFSNEDSNSNSGVKN